MRKFSIKLSHLMRFHRTLFYRNSHSKFSLYSISTRNFRFIAFPLRIFRYGTVEYFTVWHLQRFSQSFYFWLTLTILVLVTFCTYTVRLCLIYIHILHSNFYFNLYNNLYVNLYICIFMYIVIYIYIGRYFYQFYLHILFYFSLLCRKQQRV